MPQNIYLSSLVLHNGTILLCGGENNRQKCLQLDHGTWKEHSFLNEKRMAHSAVATQTASFIFGGYDSNCTYEYLPKDSPTWLIGKTYLPGRFEIGCAIASKSGNEIWLFGGLLTEKRILKFDVDKHSFHEMPFQLNVGGAGLRCAFIPNTEKIMISGDDWLCSTEILDTELETVTMASQMNCRRYNPGMGVITINGEETLAVFGGDDGNSSLDSVEIYNAQTEKWEKTNSKLKKPNCGFSFLSVKLSDIISKRQL